MRLWHQKLIEKLPRQQLLGQHRECCALRGLGWGKKHSVVDYVFTYPIYRLYLYHTLVMEEMLNRGYQADMYWANLNYRGKRLGYETLPVEQDVNKKLIYPEHNDNYYAECIENLKNKGIVIE